MRPSIIFVGAVLGSVGFSFAYFVQDIQFFITGALGVLNILLGAATARSGGIQIPDQQCGPVTLLIDRGVSRTGIYQLAFLDKKLVLKKLASGRITLFLPLALLLGGFYFGLLAAAAGALTGYSIQEFATQRNRNKIAQSKTFDPPTPGDVEFPYAQLSKVLVRRNSLLLFGENRVARINLPRGYGRKVGPALQSILPGLYKQE